MPVKSGVHLGVVHSWMQCKARNGERVTWGSNEVLEVAPTVDDLERLAQDIRDAVLKEVYVHINVCDYFRIDFSGDSSSICNKCGHSKSMHDIFKDF